jgi:hypothetical protein
MGGALGAIVGYASVLEDELGDDVSERVRRCLDGIGLGSDALAALIQEMRAYGADRPTPADQA